MSQYRRVGRSVSALLSPTCKVLIKNYCFVCLRSKVKWTLHDIYSLYSSTQAILKWRQIVRGHFVMLTEDKKLYLTSCNPGQSNP